MAQNLAEDPAQNVARTGGAAAFVARALLLGATLASALANGFGLSPVFDGVDNLLRLMLRGYPYLTGGVINAYVTPLAVALLTLVVAGIPAAVYERIRGLRSSTTASLGIWLAAALLLALPAVMRAVAGDDLR